MKKIFLLTYQLIILSTYQLYSQNVGIGTTTPNANALLHVSLDTSTTKGLLVTGTYNINSTVPDLGAGSKMMFYPGRAAFRAGYVNGPQWNNSSVGKYSVAMGYNTTASGWYSTAIGVGTKASGESSTAMGYSTTASGSYSTAMGIVTKAKGYASLVVGMFNDSLITSDETFVTNTTPLFIVGNGSSTSRSNALVVRKDGNVGIGTSTPNANALLHVALDTSTTKGLLVTGTDNASATIPDLGEGSRMMFYPGKAAFRAGYVFGTQWNNSSVGKYSVAMGLNTTASEIASSAIGSGTTASGFASTAMGYATIASEYTSTAIGYATTASGESSTAMGRGTIASGIYSTAMGTYNTASGNYSTAMGLQTTASGNYSTAMGIATKAKGYASTVVGMYNDSLLTSDQTFITPTTPLFIVGNGSSSTSRSNAMVVRKDGNVGIGVNPSHPLSFTSTLGNKVALYGSGNSHYGIGIQNSLLQLYTDFAGSDIAFGYGNSTAFTENMRIRGNGNVGIGTTTPSQKLHVVGNICATGTIGACSDIRYKTNILPISNALNSILSLQPIYYNWDIEKFTNKGFTTEQQIGFSAQEVEKLFPQMVQTDAEGYKAVDYSRLTSVLVKAVQEQQEQINEKQVQLDDKQLLIDNLKKDNDNIIARLEKLEKLLLKQ